MSFGLTKDLHILIGLYNFAILNDVKMKEFHLVDPREELTFEQLDFLLKSNQKLRLSEEAESRIKACRSYLDERMEKEKQPIYGINTGFGSLCNVKIQSNELTQLQENLVMSHACGTGELVEPELIKIMMFLKIQSLSYGHSGVQLKTVQRLVDLYNEEIYPVVYTQGSLGASGDLAPLAHLALPLIGMGEVYYKGLKRKTSELMKDFEWEKNTIAIQRRTSSFEWNAIYGSLWCLRGVKRTEVILFSGLNRIDFSRRVRRKNRAF